jgi:hypothetical protein
MIAAFLKDVDGNFHYLAAMISLLAASAGSAGFYVHLATT